MIVWWITSCVLRWRKEPRRRPKPIPIDCCNARSRTGFLDNDDDAHGAICAVVSRRSGGSWVPLWRCVAITTTQSACARKPAGAPGTPGAALPATRVRNIGRCRDACDVLDRNVSAITSRAPVTATAAIGSVASVSAVLIIFTTFAVSAVSARPS